ncbi:flagellar motor protein MotA [Novispirillum sp. DQ9]|uniref:flagellar motor protein MotA n=1 Tax=Novispirillum sp. DQ9 TaxID=3398612 RepID=UPI003C7CAC49
MNRPRRFLLRMVVFLVAVLGVAAALSPAVVPAFMANPALNGLILGVLLVGVALNIRQVVMLRPEVAWIERFRLDQDSVRATTDHGPRLLAPMATMLAEHKGRGRFMLSAPAMRSMLDGIAARLDEARDISRYFIGLSIFLGLLGTFWGLLQTIDSIAAVIGGMDFAAGNDMTAVLANLQDGISAPLEGMGTAFSSSLFGLAGSLVLGFLDLQSGQAQNAFFTDLEDWLSGITRLSSGVGDGGGDQSVPAYIQALLEQTAESIDELQRTLARGEDSRGAALTYQRDLVDRLTTLTDQMRAEQQVLLKMAEGQVELRQTLARFGEALTRPQTSAIDDASRGHLRNMDVALQRLADEAQRGRDEAVREIRSEIKLLARTIAAIAEEER